MAQSPLSLAQAFGPHRQAPHHPERARPALARKQSGPTSQPQLPALGGNLIPNPLPARSAFVRQYSGESGSSMNAEDWYDKSNRDVQRRTTNNFVDDEPPFFIDEPNSADCSSIGVAPSDVVNRSFPDDLPDATFLPSRMQTLDVNDSDSDSDIYRSVIDDVTIQNKRLKRKLTKYQRLHCSHLQREKLFEVRVHDLPGEKKRELEQILEEFARSLHHPSGLGKSSSPPKEQGRSAETGESLISSSISTSDSRPVDSAYASNPASAYTSNWQSRNANDRSTRSGVQSGDLRPRKSSTNHLRPSSILRHHPVMTEKAKKKLVVRRLEQLFTGKGIVVGDRLGPHRQQEISRSAGIEDNQNCKDMATSRSEGIREARISLAEPNTPPDNRPGEKEASQLNGTGNGVNPPDVGNGESPGIACPEQRPTRPLDLDPDHPKPPTENVEYLRHLGLPTPNLGTIAPDNADGWVWLNLLTNMAQLHTINVTPEFVRAAVCDVSAKFELSGDGRKVRWRGGAEGTRMSSDTGSNAERLTSSSPDNVAAPSHPHSKRPKTSARPEFSEIPRDPIHESRLPGAAPRGSRNGGRSQASLAPVQTQKLRSSLVYHPVIVPEPQFRDDEDEDLFDSDSLDSSPMQDHHNGSRSFARASTTQQSSRSSAHKKESGPIIFYNHGRFCTDLSGDTTLGGSKIDRLPQFDRLTDTVLGISSSPLDGLASYDILDPHLLTSADALSVAESEHDAVVQGLTELGISTGKHRRSDEASGDHAFIDFEASGISGILPSDNFAIEVRQILSKITRSQLQSTDAVSMPSDRKGHRASIIQQLVAHLYSDETSAGRRLASASHWPLWKSQRPSVILETTSTKQTHLQPSALPPPSYLFLPLSPSEDGDDDSDSSSASSGQSGSASTASRMRAVRAARARQGLNRMSLDGMSPESSANEGDADSDSSIDLLASARQLDPASVAEKEREFERNCQLQAREEVQSGSLAATVGILSDEDDESGDDDKGSEDDEEDEGKDTRTGPIWDWVTKSGQPSGPVPAEAAKQVSISSPKRQRGSSAYPTSSPDEKRARKV